MLATYDVRRSPTRMRPVTFAVAASLILGGAGGFLLKGLTQAAQLSSPAPAVVTSLAAPMASRNISAQMARIELSDQRSQAQSARVPANGAADESNHANSRFGPR